MLPWRLIPCQCLIDNCDTICFWIVVDERWPIESPIVGFQHNRVVIWTRYFKLFVILLEYWYHPALKRGRWIAEITKMTHIFAMWLNTILQTEVCASACRYCLHTQGRVALLHHTPDICAESTKIHRNRENIERLCRRIPLSAWKEVTLWRFVWARLSPLARGLPNNDESSSLSRQKSRSKSN